MKTATVRQLLHDFSGVLRWVEEGEEVQISKHGKVIALLKPPRPSKPPKIQMPDFAARAKSYCGDFVLSDKALQSVLDDEG
jgi:antitoxin (DNA-binding transcriptional repressor) of toxin-antitoxin stability system